MAVHPAQRATQAQIEAEVRRELCQERAAILEFDAGLSRAEAERLALKAHPMPHSPGPFRIPGGTPLTTGRDRRAVPPG